MKQSWKTSGWTHALYHEKMVVKLLKERFPYEVLDAYNSLQPGRFKSDLARYCVLFVHGGIYADIDLLLEVNLDNGIEDDIGFLGVVDKVRRLDGINCNPGSILSVPSPCYSSYLWLILDS